MSLGAGYSGGPVGAGKLDKSLSMSLSDTLRLAWADEELRRRLTFVLIVFAVYALGVHVPVPIRGIDLARMGELLKGNQFFALMNTIGGGAFKRISIFSLGLGPYISSSIILQVMSMGIPSWKLEMKEGGEYARKQQNRRTRILTVALSLLQGAGVLVTIEKSLGINLAIFDRAAIILFWMTGSMILLWLGEQITEKGIGNGISMIIFAGIVISLPNTVQLVYNGYSTGVIYLWSVIALILLFLGTTWLVVLFTTAQRRIPILHQRRQFGTKTMGGQTSYLPISVNLAGVIPIIFALALLNLPQSFATVFTGSPPIHDFLLKVSEFLSPNFTRWQGYVGALVYTAVIFFFTYFWTALQYNVEDIADNLKRGGSYIQGIRPGKQTKDFLDQVISRVTFVGAGFLAVIALTQFLLPLIINITNFGFIGGTSLLIMVSVALETMRQIEANLLTKQYEG